MKQMLTLFTLLFLVVDAMVAQASSGTGVISYRLTNAGSLTLSNGSPYVHANREIGRVTIVVSSSKDAVFDYNEDQNSTVDFPAKLVTIAGVDSAVEVMTDNSYSLRPPKIRVRIKALSWNNQKYVIARYTVIADSANLGSMYHGVVVVPRVGAVYGGETVKYNATAKAAYFYREGEASYWGVKALSPQIFGFRALDWDEYSVDPDNDVASDSLRELMTKHSSFDAPIVAGSNGSIYSVNTGKNTFTNLGDSAVLYFAVGYGATEAELFASLDSATVKFGKITTSVRPNDDMTPNGFSLGQNFPNPFNPTTQIRFSVGASSFVSLSVYDALGREVQTLVRQQLESGSYTATLSAAHLSSGLYYYTMQAGSFRETKKMMLMK